MDHNVSDLDQNIKNSQPYVKKNWNEKHIERFINKLNTELIKNDHNAFNNYPHHLPRLFD